MASATCFLCFYNLDVPKAFSTWVPSSQKPLVLLHASGSDVKGSTQDCLLVFFMFSMFFSIVLCLCCFFVLARGGGSRAPGAVPNSAASRDALRPPQARSSSAQERRTIARGLYWRRRAPNQTKKTKTTIVNA